MKAQIEIDQLHPIPDNHIVLTPVGSGPDTKWLDLRAEDRYRFVVSIIKAKENTQTVLLNILVIS